MRRIGFEFAAFAVAIRFAKKSYGKLANIRRFSFKNEGLWCAFPEVTTTAEAEAKKKKSSQPTTGVEEKKNPSIL